jgi:pyrroline-5-carboxylate reductase
LYPQDFENMSPRSKYRIGFIGAGRMAQALARGIAQRYPQLEFVIADPAREVCEQFRKIVDELAIGSAHSRVEVVESNADLFAACADVVLAVKPQCFPAAVDQINPAGRAQPLVISVIAGISIAQLQRATQVRSVIRLMPNTPCLIGEGMTAMACADTVASSDRERISEYLHSIGLVQLLDEPLLDAVTGLSGSGPAYVLQFIEALVQGGMSAGLPQVIAQRLAVQTVLGTARMLQKTEEHPAVLRDQVTSPGGTTIAGLRELQRNGFNWAVIAAVERAAARASELGEQTAAESSLGDKKNQNKKNR